MYLIVCETGSTLRSTFPLTFTLNLMLRVLKNRLKFVTEGQDFMRQNETKSKEGRRYHGAFVL